MVTLKGTHMSECLCVHVASFMGEALATVSCPQRWGRSPWCTAQPGTPRQEHRWPRWGP